MEKYLVPEPVGEGDLTDQWTRFKKEFNLFLLAIGKADASGGMKLAILLRAVGQRVNDIHEALVFAEGENKDDFDTVVQKLDSVCARRTSKHVIRDRFFQMKQDHRTIDQFVADLRKQVKDCEFGALKDDLMLHVLIRGVDSDRMRRRLFETDKLELPKAIQMCQTMEATSADLESWVGKEKKVDSEVPVEVKSVSESAESVSAVQRSGYQKPTNTRTRENDQGQRYGEVRECRQCGRTHKPRQCPAYGQKCLKCGLPNHFARRCRNSAQTHMVQGDSQSLGHEEVLHITVRKCGKKLLARMQFIVANKKVMVECQMDTAATCNVLSWRDYLVLGKPALENSVTTLVMYDGSVRKSLGGCHLQVEVAERKVKSLYFEVMKSNHHSLLSLDTCLTLNLLSYKIGTVYAIQEEQKVTRLQVLEEFDDVFGGLGSLPGEYEIEIDEMVHAVQNRPRKIPHTMKEAVENKLTQLVDLGVIAPVDVPTEWVSNITAVWKPDKKQVRICLDPRDLNKAIKRNHFYMPTIDDVLPKLKGAKIFSLLDAKDGFLQVKLTDRSSYLTTFWGPSGQFRWLRMPFGISSAPEEFQRRLQGALHGLSGVAVVADDVLVFGVGSTMEEARVNHDDSLLKLLQRARECNLKLNREKLRLHMPEVLYIGHIISANGIRPDPAKVTAIQEMPEPAGVSDVRRFLGMCNYLSRYVPRLSEVSEPLRRLTEAEATFGWGVEEKSAFEKLKELISDQQRLAFYDVRKPVVIQCDASTVGLGAVLMQEGRPVASVSRSLSKSEKNYVAIELECLAIVFACQKFHQYIFGKKVRIETDHKPLEIIVRKPILSAPRRLQRMLLLLQRYSLEVVFRPGEQQVLADTLSRAPAGTTAISAPEEEIVFQLQIIKEHEFLPISDQRIAAIKSAAARDAEYAMLSKIIKQEWPQKIDHIPEAVRSYWNFRETMTVQDGVVYKGGQVVVPVEVRPDIVVRLHSSHQGIQSTLRRAQDVVYWPGMKKDIEKAVRRCAVCEENAPALPKEECRAHEIMGRLWEKVGMDLFHCRGKDFLIIVDYLTDFFEITELLEVTASAVVQACKQQFARHGIPVWVHTDGGSQFTAWEFARFSKTWGFQHTLSSPYNSQSNGKAESAVKIAKRLMKRSTDPYLALLEWRNTPTIGMGSSPAQRLLSRRTRGTVPIASSKLHPEVQTHVLEKKEQKQHKMLQSSGGAKRRALPPLETGKPILAQDMRAFKTQWKRGTCVSQLSDRSYIVDIEGQLVRRNRRFLKQSENPPGEGELVDKDEAIDSEVMREMGEGQTEQTLDKTTEQLGVDSSLNTEEDTVEPSTNAEQQPGEPKAFTSSGNGANPGQVLRADGEGSSVYKTRSGRASRVPAKYRDYVKI